LQILAADDEPFNRKLLEAQLQDHPLIREGRLILHAVDGGEAAWSWIETTGTPPDLLLLDWRMPDLDGVALLERIRRRHPDVPAIALTAQADADALEALQQAGFDAVLEKPFGQSALFGHLDQLLGIAGVPSDEAALAELVDTPGGLDLTDLEALAGGDGTFVTDMLEIFLERLEATREHWEAAIENKDRKAIAEAAHKLAAPARQLGFTELAAALRALEEDADGDASIAALANRCRRLQPMLQTAQLQVAAKLEEGSQAP
jgi:CheY-like chemotaxis protein